MKIRKINTDRLFIIFIVLLAAILRLYNADAIPYTHDEFSALFRTNFNTFAELINGGVLPDTHPAGVQVFMFYWVKLFGADAMIVKLPFILMGIASVYLLWLIATNWFNTTVALLAALFLATLEYPIMHSQIARPYISGMFLSLWMVYHWTKYLFKTNTTFNSHLVLYVIASAFCSYNHHFSLLFAAIVGLSGLFFIDRKRILPYALAGLSIFLLYVPHLSIFFHQLHKGGVGGDGGWLGPPQSDFLWQFITYIFNFSTLLLVLVAIIVLVGLRYPTKQFNEKKKFLYLSLTWFLIPFVIGYFYSQEVNPVLQYSVLIFSFPFFFFILFGHIKDLSFKWKGIITLLLLPILLYTLIEKREYYTLFYNSPYIGMVENTAAFQENYGNKKIVSFIDSDQMITRYYSDKMNKELDLRDISIFKNNFYSILSSNDISELSMGANTSSNAVLPSIIYDYFPRLVKKIDYNQATYYEFSKRDGNAVSMYRSDEYENDFENNAVLDPWHFNEINIVVVDSLEEEHGFQFQKDQEWGLSFDIDLSKLEVKQNDFIDIRLGIKSWNVEDELLIVSEIAGEGEKYDWRSSSNRSYIPRDKSGDYRMYHTIKLSDLHYPPDKVQLKVYCWNKGKTEIIIDDFSIKVRIGNPVLYGLLRNIEND